MIARKSALIIATNIINGVLGYISLYFITKYMQPADYGIVAFALGFVSLFAVFENMGFHSSHIKKVSEGKDFGVCNGTFLSIKIVLTSLLIIIVFGSLFFWRIILGRGFETSEHEVAIYIMLGYMAIRSIAYFFNVSFRAKKEIAKQQTPLFFETIVRAGSTIVVALLGYGALALATTYILGDIAFLCIGIFLFRGYPIKKPSKSYLKDYTIFAVPLILVVVSSTIMNNFDRVFIQLFWSASDVGYYFSAFKLSSFINMFTVALVTLLFPTYSALHASRNIKRISELTYKSERYMSMIVFPMVFGMITLAEPSTNILLSGWLPALPILQILPLFALFAALEAPYQSQFIGTNRPKLARNRVLIMMVVNVLLNLVLIPQDIRSIGLVLFGLGSKGAAIATVISYVAGLIYSRIWAWRITKVKGNWRIAIHAISATIMSSILYLILYHFNLIVSIERWYHLLGFSLFGLMIYVIFLQIFNEFSKDDLNFFLDALNLRKMYSYIKFELFK